MGYNLSFSPLLPNWLIIALIVAIIILVAIGLFRQVRGSLIRALVGAFVALTLLNPSLLIEDREALKSVVALIVDETGSQKLDGRSSQTQAAKDELIQRLSRLDAFDVREINASDQISTTTDISTALFSALQSGLKDVSSTQIAGAIMITDGQVHDIPKNLENLGIKAPIHALITGKENERDRRIRIVEAQRYGVVGESFEISYEVLQEGFQNSDQVAVEILIDGNLISTELVQAGEIFYFVGDVPHGGKNIIELRAAVDPLELTASNNRVFTTLNGIRENLRVLLVSGEPHSGERTWRNLLKSDASVDLVHFTILRPPGKQDGTPITQLSLIAFPTRELFVEKIDEFDLIIFDRYSRRGVLPLLYFDNIARYVREGGAVLVASGPEYGGGISVAKTPLSSVLPALPNGEVDEGPFKPLISELGQKHPVTRGLDNGKSEDPAWSRWFRSISVEPPQGEVVMLGPDEKPLLVLGRYDEGRVALMLSDHSWLWARGFEGGGPHVQLLRRISHWLMKEPELEEERLTASGNENNITISRQTLGEQPQDPIVTLPSGEQVTVKLNKKDNGIFEGVLEAKEVGLYQINDGELSTLAQIGTANPREFANVISSTNLLDEVTKQSGGSVQRLAENGTDIPRLLPVRIGASANGNGWIGLRKTDATVLKGIDRISLFSGLLGLTLLLLGFAAVWTREGR